MYFKSLPCLKEGNKGHPELVVHEAVGDGVAAGTNVGEEVHEGDPCGPDVPVDDLWTEKVPSVENMERSPAYEELCHYHEEHTNDLERVI